MAGNPHSYVASGEVLGRILAQPIILTRFDHAAVRGTMLYWLPPT
jgi:hypothetical protein